ncbi:hypothetical protein [Ornithinimicrobium avium]|uniref:Uncharacterized protein n=1 Tax=Ornithinimicrobium avium TaxID=2283195 RepID=A0A345NM05_9MICO|nr:hypothetical protein [Ornithinimicrobium avium]AXH96063.1 hypothetical protein DV701_07905 [Ornithinimicrobium avium]
MGLIDTLRIEDTVQRYDFWLEMRGTGWRRRKELRRELRANLRAATEDVGATQALLNVGAPKELAREATDGEYQRRPQWSRAGFYAALTLGAVLFAVVYTATTFTAGVEAAGMVGQDVTGRVFPWPWVEFHARIEEGRGGLTTGASGAGWPVVVLPLVVFVLTARPWRVLTARSGQVGEQVG